MAIILNSSINLSEIPKDKIITGKKGKYLPITITVNDELDKFGNQGPVTVQQTKEERDQKSPKTFLGNVKVVWTNGSTQKLEGQSQGNVQAQAPVQAENDLPF